MKTQKINIYKTILCALVSSCFKLFFYLFAQPLNLL